MIFDSFRTGYTFPDQIYSMKLLGLTGNIACVKSSVAVFLQKRGAVVLDADDLVHELYSDANFFNQVAALFGSEVLGADQIIDLLHKSV